MILLLPKRHLLEVIFSHVITHFTPDPQSSCPHVATEHSCPKDGVDTSYICDIVFRVLEVMLFEGTRQSRPQFNCESNW